MEITYSEFKREGGPFTEFKEQVAAPLPNSKENAATLLNPKRWTALLHSKEKATTLLNPKEMAATLLNSKEIGKNFGETKRDCCITNGCKREESILWKFTYSEFKREVHTFSLFRRKIDTQMNSKEQTMPRSKLKREASTTF